MIEVYISPISQLRSKNKNLKRDFSKDDRFPYCENIDFTEFSTITTTQL